MKKIDLANVIKETLRAETESLQMNLQNSMLCDQLVAAGEMLYSTSNRIITCGMGKSGLIARKIAATLTSTGSPSVYLHPADALHGDIGNIQSKEVVLAFSNSGETREIVELMPHIRLLRGKVVAITQKPESTLAKDSDVAVIYAITREGCPLDLAPMASTTVSLALGDALSAALIKMRKFQKADFGKFHPSGSLGRRLVVRVKDLMQKADHATVRKTADFKSVLGAMVSSNMGSVLVTGSKGHLRGIITDGDIKRILDKFSHDIQSVFNKTAEEIMTKDPISAHANQLAEEAIATMSEIKTYNLPVVNNEKKPVGIIRMHDLISGNPGRHSEK